MDYQALIAEARDHRARQQAVKEREILQKQDQLRLERLEKWRPHLEAIRAALPPEVRDCIQEPTDKYQQYSDWVRDTAYSPVEIKLGHISVFAWHYFPVGSLNPQVYFAPGQVSLNEETSEIYSAPSMSHRIANDTRTCTFLEAVAEAADHYDLNYKRLEALCGTTVPKPDLPPPSIAEQLEWLLRAIVLEEIAGQVPQGPIAT